MFGAMVKEANQREDAKAYVAFREVFAKFHAAVKEMIGKQFWFYSQSTVISSTSNVEMGFMFFDRIFVSSLFSMVANVARTKRAGRVIFSRHDGDEPKVLWVIYFDEQGNVNEKPYQESKVLNILEPAGIEKLIMCLIDKCEPCFEVVE